jgi:hypothetical protein
MSFKTNQKWVLNISTFLFLCSLFFVLFEDNRSDFGSIFLPFSIAFVSYFFIVFHSVNISTNYLLGLTCISFVLGIILIPHLSTDYFRFLWDGEIFWKDINPYDFTPNEIIHSKNFVSSPYFKELHNGMGELSQINFSCYTPLNQFFFIFSTWFTDSIYWNTIILKCLVAVTQFFGLIYLQKLLKHLAINVNKAFILFLNPLFIIESIGNVHFEGVMISFLIIAIYFLIKLKIFPAGIFFSLAIQIKLIPLLLLPFLWRFIGWKKAVITYSIIGIGFLIVSISLLNSSNFGHFMHSIKLYFELFQFNSSFLFVLLQLDPLHYYYHKIGHYSFILSFTTFIMILYLAFWKKIIVPKALFSKMTIAYFIYLLSCTTLHPWYILPALFLSVFTNYTFLILWSFTVFLSYSFYSNGNVATTNWLLGIEYIPVLLLFVYEMVRGGLFQRIKVNLEERI